MQKVTNKDILRQLLLAKAMSDKKDYTGKYNIMQKMIKDNPDDFIIDQEDPNFPGITHVPTGFKMHLPSSIKPAISKSAAVDGRVSDLTSHENYEGIKQDRKMSTVTLPRKSGLSGFITNLKKGKLAEPDRRFNNIDASLKLAKQAMLKEAMDPYRLAVNLLKFNTKSRGVSNNITLLQRLRSVVELNKPTTRRAFISEASTLPKQTNISNKPVASTKSIAPYLYQPQLNRRNFIKRFALGIAVDKPTREVVKGVTNGVVQIPQKALHLL